MTQLLPDEGLAFPFGRSLAKAHWSTIFPWAIDFPWAIADRPAAVPRVRRLPFDGHAVQCVPTGFRA